MLRFGWLVGYGLVSGFVIVWYWSGIGLVMVLLWSYYRCCWLVIMACLVGYDLAGWSWLSGCGLVLVWLRFGWFGCGSVRFRFGYGLVMVMTSLVRFCDRTQTTINNSTMASLVGYGLVTEHEQPSITQPPRTKSNKHIAIKGAYTNKQTPKDEHKLHTKPDQIKPTTKP